MRSSLAALAAAVGLCMSFVAGCGNAEPRTPSGASACPKGTGWDGENCVTSKVVCPTGSTWNGSACAGNVAGGTGGGAGGDAPEATSPKAPPAGATKGPGFWCFHSVYDGFAEDECRPTRAACNTMREREQGMAKTESVGECTHIATAYCHSYKPKGTDTAWRCSLTAQQCDVASRATEDRGSGPCGGYPGYPGPSD